MMGMVETTSKVPPEGSSSPSEEKDNVQGSEFEKKKEEEEEELKEEALCALKDGVGFSSIENRRCSGDDVVGEVVKSRVVETEVSVARENDSQGLADSEMNGTSSLLRMQGSCGSVVFSGGYDGVEKLKNEEEEKNEDCDGEIVPDDVPVVDKEDVESEGLSDEGYEFSAGDFVWGKIKSHPWWPGQIYNPSAASHFALKLKQKNRLLVAYFGDGTFAWCHPLQLKPFEENFEDMVKQSSSRTFVNAVQEAVNEVGRLLHIKMTHSFVAKRTRSEFAPLWTKNSGIKEGVCVPENGIERFSVVSVEPSKLLSQVKQIAKVVAIASALELEILKAQLSAFFLSRGGYKLPTYEDPLLVPGLEDRSMDAAVDVGNRNGTVETLFQGPFGELCQSPGISGNRSNHGRKQKSIAEILGEDRDVHTENEGDSTDEVVEAIRSTRRKKKKSSQDYYTESNVPSGENDGSKGKENIINGRSLRSKKKEAFGNEYIDNGSEKESDEEIKTKHHEKGSLQRERKKSRYLSPPFTTSLKVSSETRESEDDAFQENFSNEVAIDWELSDSSNHHKQEDEDEKKTIDLTKIQVPSGEVLSKVHYAAANLESPGESTSLEQIVDFISAFRNSLYHRGSCYKAYNKRQRGRKRNTDQNQTDHISPDHDSEPRKRRKKERTPLLPKAKEGSDENATAAALFVSFYPGSTLPSKTDLITVYSKFGALNEAETEMFRTNYTARVCFLKASDAEKALNHSQNTNPFEPSDVTFQLQCLSAGSKSLEHGERSKFKPSPPAKKKDKEAPTATPTVVSLSWGGSEASKLDYIKQKLQGVTSMIEASDGKSPEMKTSLLSEVKGLLDDVSKMAESSS
ncbi:hypothetical protein RIF29_18715 [Crotalaria pallida]|uniref:PWWP domain-containing protein n=1 Tax=Crotalaria pallida TaxID=3830 RepID=A0AAN9F0G0_CROPI